MEKKGCAGRLLAMGRCMEFRVAGGGAPRGSVETRKRDVQSFMMENKGLRSATFARLAKLMAVSLVAVALWRAAPPVAPARVVVLVLPGFEEKSLASLGLEDRRGNWGGTVSTPGPGNGALFWQRLFNLAAPGQAPTPVWEGTFPRVAVISPPETVFRSPAGEVPRSTRPDFVGGNAGMVVDAREVAMKRLVSPYDRAAQRLVVESDSLRRGQWSDWIPVAFPDTGIVGEFQVTRCTDELLFLSPVYVVSDRAEMASSDLARPFLRGLAPELKDAAVGHLIAVQRRRFGASNARLRQDSSPTSAIIFDLSAQEVGEVFLPGETPAAAAAIVANAVSAQIVELRDLVGTEGLIVVVGGPAMGRDQSGKGWLRILGVSGESTGTTAFAELDFPVARVVLRYLLGIALTQEERASVPLALAARLPIRSAPPASVHANTTTSSSAWSAEEIEAVPRAVSSLGS